MSRKANHTAEAASPTPTKLYASDLGHIQIYHEKRNSPSKQARSPSLTRSVQGNTKGSAGAEGTDEGTTCADDNDAEDSDSDSVQTDEKNSDTEDPDVLAPPGLAMDEDSYQAGQPTNTPNPITCSNDLTTSYEEDSQHDTSDDEVYAAIDLISDSEKDGSDMDHLEERAIVDFEDEQRSTGHASINLDNNKSAATHGPSHESSDDAWEGLDSGDGQFYAASFFDEQFDRIDGNNIFDHLDDDFFGFHSDLARTTHDSPKSPSTPSHRRVRFAEPLHEDITGSNPSNHVDLESPDEMKQEPMPSSDHGFDDASDEDSDSSSGYESDYGETTDEDDIPATATARPQALLRRPSAGIIKASSPTVSIPASKSGKLRGPVMAKWCIDPTKPLAIVDSCGKRLLVCPARRPKKPDRVFAHLTGSSSTTANTSPLPPPSRLTIAPNDSDAELSDFSSQGIVSPMFGPPNALDNALLDSNFLATATVYPESRTLDMAAYSNIEYNDYDDDDDDDYENAIKMEDLFNLNSDDDDSDAGYVDTCRSSSAQYLSSRDQGSHHILDHLDTAGVTAFRQNQYRTEQDQQEILQPRSPLRKRKASPPLHPATRRKIMT